MKRKITLFLVTVMILALAGCGDGQEQSSKEQQGADASEYEQALDVLNAVVDTYAEDELFSMYGGDSEHAVTDAPGVYDIRKKEELDASFGLSGSEYDKVGDVATMVHMMNANIFTGAAYHLKDGTDIDAFVEVVESNILSKQWVCGQPDTLVMIRVGDAYVISVYGEAETVETFKTHALSALSGAEVITETPIV